MGGAPFIEEAPGTFGGYLPERARSIYSLVGVPFDSTSSYRSGQRWGPRAIREASAFIEFTSLHAGLDVEEVPIYDEGDVGVVHGDARETLRRVSAATRALAGEGRRLIVLGGEHTVTYGVLEGLASALGRTPCLVVLDAHFDLRGDYLGNPYSHACVMRRVLERLHPPRVYYVGVRGFAREELELASSREGVAYSTSLDVERLGEANVAARVKRFLGECGSVYLSVDLDFLDPSQAPGVGNPEPGGLTFREALNLIHAIVDERLVGFDVVELAPPHDPAGLTAVVAAKLVVEVVAAHARALRRARRRGGV
ncbi:MAG: agmatinase [Desulfurococcales archaeon]|nr:agmatinase [Desulfurococcales archaeon]